jgi:uncharacterized protein (DUF58 family)
VPCRTRLRQRTHRVARFVDPKVLARIGNLEFCGALVVDGFINGLHRAPFFGASVDFAEHRGYVPGDDIRRVDWRLFARTDRYYLKEYEADTNANFSVLLDVSKSMAFGARARSSTTRSTWRPASPTCAHRSATASASSPSTGHRRARAAVGQALRRGAAHARPGDGRAAGPDRAAAAQDGRALRRRGIVVRHLGLLRGARRDARGHRAAPLPRQRRHRVPRARPGGDRLPVRRPASFEDLESGEQLPVVPERWREQYRALVQAHIEALHRSATAQRFQYLSIRDRLTRTR